MSVKATCKRKKKKGSSSQGEKAVERNLKLGLNVATCSLSFEAHAQGSTGIVAVVQRVT